MHVVQAATPHSPEEVTNAKCECDPRSTSSSQTISSCHGDSQVVTRKQPHSQVLAARRRASSMLEPVLPAVLDLLVHGCLVVSVSSFLIVLALQPLLPGGSVATAASRGVRSASRAVLVRLLPVSGRSDAAVAVAVAPPPPPPRQSRRSSRHCCERCAAASWPDAVAAVTASLRLDDDESEEEDAAAACGGCAASAAVEGLLERKEATERELREAFRVFDRDDDGFVGAGELWNVLRRLGMRLPDGAAAREDCCARMIAAHDGDGDGRISFPEFRAMMEHAA